MYTYTYNYIYVKSQISLNSCGRNYLYLTAEETEAQSGM